MAASNDLIIFDCDGVLVDSETLAVEAFVEVLVEAGVPTDAATVEQCFGMKQADILAWLAERTGRAIPPDVPDRLWPATRRHFERALKPMAGVAAFLEQLGPAKRCVASSSSPERIAFSLGRTGLDGFFGEAVFSSHQVARGKPAPDLFLFAAARMGVEPRRCLVIEDSVFGVRGALAAGMAALGFAGGSHVPPDHDETLLRVGAGAVERSWGGIARRLLAAA